MNADHIVVDASVAVKWFAEEAHAEEAAVVAERYADLLAPPLIIPEVSNALRKKLRAGEIGEDHARQAVQRLIGEVNVVLGDEYPVVAFELAVRYDRTVYDCQYVALALQEGCQLVTADEKLYNALKDVYPTTMLWLGDVTPQSVL